MSARPSAEAGSRAELVRLRDQHVVLEQHLEGVRWRMEAALLGAGSVNGDAGGGTMPEAEAGAGGSGAGAGAQIGESVSAMSAVAAAAAEVGRSKCKPIDAR
jgi:hypothetical protein